MNQLASRRAFHRAARGIFASLTLILLLAGAAPAIAWESTPASFSEAFPEATQFSRESLSRLLIAPEHEVSAVTEEELVEVAPASPAPALGRVIVNTAMAYVGYPYVYAGAGPGGFDCSGFTSYIVGITTGIWIPHAVEAQPYAAGYWVDYGAWLPGDLIYFQNTYRPGISHAAIYIGDGLIVHAENEGSGVTIDSIYSSYYGPRYWGAIRIG